MWRFIEESKYQQRAQKFYRVERNSEMGRGEEEVKVKNEGEEWNSDLRNILPMTAIDRLRVKTAEDTD
jgi:hypothetical protein